ncbi:MAG: 3-phosphoshikimate 1-carboxyvinyltransferase [Phycisphaerales bacterium]|nr:3-phosphoshikimate 1-carboxyvinyltransferase [Phycisphaerales bacterium]
MNTPASAPDRGVSDPYPVPLLRHPAHGTIRPPGSRSITNRAILLAALAHGESVLRAPLLGADDTERMITAVTRLGATVRRGDDHLRIRGVGGRCRSGLMELDAGESGTCARFLTAAAVLSLSPVIITGGPRLRERPMDGLPEALGQLGARAEFLGSAGCLPLRVTPPVALPAGATVALESPSSGQVISGLLLAAPFLPGGLTVRVTGRLPSASYVRMTVALLDRVGVGVRTSEDLRTIRVGAPPPGPPAFTIDIEPDASSAGYWWALAALSPGSRVRVEGLSRRSLQGDALLPDVLSRMGAGVAWGDGSIEAAGPPRLCPVMADFSDMPDAALTVAAVACFADGASVLSGLGTLRGKESDRLAALSTELARISVRVDVHADGATATITPPRAGLDCSAGASRVAFGTYNDHRVAMSLALIGLRRPNTLIRNPGCVAKTYPGFWHDLAGLTG